MRKALLVALVLALLATSALAAGTDESAKIVRAFVDRWFKGDLDQTMSYLTEDVTWWNVPMEPITGQAKSREFLAPFVHKDPRVVPFTFRTEVKQTLADGPNVVIERVDSFDINGKKWQIPVVAVFEVKNGKIAVWKDYFDMGQFQPVDTLIQSLLKKK
jgi:limonene-1,2-epoxide hydrolase